MLIKSTFKTDVQKTDVDFFNCNFEPDPQFLYQWHEVIVKNRCNNAPFLTSILTPGFISWKIGFVSLFKWGMLSNLQSQFFIWLGGSWCYKVQSVEIQNATTTMTKMIEYLRTERITPQGMTEAGKGDGVASAALPVPSPHRRAQRSGEMEIIGRDGQEFRPRREGGLSPRKRRRKTPHYGRAPPRRGLENSTPNPIRHHPQRGTSRKIWLPGDDGC